MHGLKHTMYLKSTIIGATLALAVGMFVPASGFAMTTTDGSGSSAPTTSKSAPANTAPAFVTPCTNNSKYCCGADPQVETAIDIGCRREGNPIMDMLFAALRLLSDGVGLVIVGSIIFGGVQYTMSAGDPQATAKAVGRIRATLLALLLFIFAYPLLNWLLPTGFFK